MKRRPLRLCEMSAELQAAVADPSVGLACSLTSRHYAIVRVYPGSLPRRQGYWGFSFRKPLTYTIDYCPFSGILLPGDVHSRHISAVKKELGLEYDSFDPAFDACLPKAFKCEQWWIERHIGPTLYPRHVRAHQEQLAREVPDYDWPPAPDSDWPASLTRSLERPPHLCPHTLEVMSRGYYTYWYLPQTREYGIRIVDPFVRVENQPIRILPVPYCPWCGEKLPKNLRAEWLARLAALGLDQTSPNIPPDLLSDRWWAEAIL